MPAPNPNLIPLISIPHTREVGAGFNIGAPVGTPPVKGLGVPYPVGLPGALSIGGGE